LTFVSHGIVAAPPVSLSVAGLRGRPLVWIDCGELGLWATELDAQVRLERDDAFAHHRVVEEICDAQACLPVRFGTAFGSAESARSSIADRAGDLRSALARVEGKRELAVTLLWRSIQPSPAQPEPAAGVGPGARFMEQRRAAYAARDERRARASELAECLVSELATERELVWHEICTSANVAVSLAALVPSERALERKEELARVVARFPDVTGVVNGPWPPYSFAGFR
jgi:gas vesicle protein GvpL/GvpF